MANYDKQYYQAHRAEILKRAKAWHLAHPGVNLEVQKRRNKRLRDEMIKAYGGQCYCCGEKTAEFLSIDHIFNDGQADRKEIGRGISMLSNLRKRGWPKERLRLACMNCNWATRWGHICPHQVDKTAKAI
jgi:hypothetical protein